MEVQRETGVDPLDLAREIGITKQRMNYLLRTGRVVGAWQDSSGRWQIPPDPQIQRGDRERPGPLTRYIHQWEARHDVRDTA